jgi:hypothetical protein
MKTIHSKESKLLLEWLSLKRLLAGIMMCQHFSGHIIKQLYAAFQILQETGSHC